MTLALYTNFNPKTLDLSVTTLKIRCNTLTYYTQGTNLSILTYIFSFEFCLEHDLLNENITINSKPRKTLLHLALITIGRHKFEFPAHKEFKSILDSNRAL